MAHNTGHDCFGDTKVEFTKKVYGQVDHAAIPRTNQMGKSLPALGGGGAIRIDPVGL